ncbi:MAG: peroxiredoxin [Gammaproteobacteria bacterium]|nr:peroxiredoxin [Gammaproteobacteria bacterium]
MLKFMRLAVLLSSVLALGAQAETEWVGKPFPNYDVKNQNGDVITNEKYKDKWVAYYFYPKDNTPGCSIEAENFAKNQEKLEEVGLEVVGISLDDVESHAEFAKDFNLKFDLLADTEKELSEKLDMVNILPWPHTRRETFIVNGEGVIVKHYAQVNPRKHVSEIIEDMKVLAK